MKNIFDILSVADKELVHSAMLQFFIESDNWKGDFFEFLVGKKKDVFYPKLEYSDSFQEGTKKKRIRFDLVLFEDKEQTKPILIIENKFKATPTVEQLKLYDEFIYHKKLNSSKKEPISKILFVFSLDSVSGNISDYCKNNNWNIMPYITNLSGDSSLLKILKDKLEGISAEKCNKELLFIRDYSESIESYSTIFNGLLSSRNFPKYVKDNKFEYRQFLINFQKRIWEKLDISEKLKEKIDVGIGTNDTPSVHFWFKLGEEYSRWNKRGIVAIYSAIDGSTFKLGIEFEKEKSENLEVKDLINELNNTKLFECFNQKDEIKRKNKSLKKTSVHAVFTKKLDPYDAVKSVEKVSYFTKEYFEFWFN